MSSAKHVKRKLSEKEIEQINSAVNSYGKEVDRETEILTVKIDPEDDGLLKHQDEYFSIKGPETAEEYPTDDGIYPELDTYEHEGPVFFNEDERRELDRESNILIGDHSQTRNHDTNGWNIVNRRMDGVNAYITANRSVVKIVNFDEDKELTLNIDGEKYEI
ncbi:hypothetical protein [Candidatus Nanohalovita haloferacivicina]|uniref:hypothetical protein n=1 Tax=Candidatus Nanohalovita haloferacivicina TaxID=2978046 RepID=UPI00325FC1E7|nr:hypothetical protein HBNXNv_0024 [Candidatus Nanohalobia archaeon BNXNv]